MNRILVTGATGFIGRALMDALAKDGYALRAAVRRPPPYTFSPGADVFEHGDLAQSVDWRPALAGIDNVIHLAGIAHIGSGVAPELYDRVNRLATEHIATAAAAAGVRNFVFVSSLRAQTGPSADHVITESDPATPTDAYGRSKLAAEQAVRSAGVPFTIFRPAVLYGPGAKGNVALLARVAAFPGPLPLRDFSNRRSMLGIDNFISAVRFALLPPGAIGETYILTDPGVPPRLSDVIATLRRAQGRRAFLFPMPPALLKVALCSIGRAALWERIGGELQADAGKLIAAGWRPEHDTLTGLARMVQAAMPAEPGKPA
jgi:nucleoside-diphosphate-sugar epimerase